MDPCGAPRVTDSRLKQSLLYATYCVRLKRESEIQLSLVPQIP